MELAARSDRQSRITAAYAGWLPQGGHIHDIDWVQIGMDYAAGRHPDWVQIGMDYAAGKQPDWRRFIPGWVDVA